MTVIAFPGHAGVIAFPGHAGRAVARSLASLPSLALGRSQQ